MARTKAGAKKPTKAKAKTVPKKKPAYPTLVEYLESVAANEKTIGLERSIDSMIDMYRYELHTELGRMQKEAARIVEIGDPGIVVTLAAACKLTLDQATAERILRELVAAERYESIEE